MALKTSIACILIPQRLAKGPNRGEKKPLKAVEMIFGSEYLEVTKGITVALPAVLRVRIWTGSGEPPAMVKIVPVSLGTNESCQQVPSLRYPVLDFK